MKDIKQIQEENRQIILETIFGTHEEAIKNNNLSCEIKGNYNSLPITLSRVLFAAKNSAIIPTAYWATRDYIVHVWDLSKETLEEQSEETQRAVWELLTGNEYC